MRAAQLVGSVPPYGLSRLQLCSSSFPSVQRGRISKPPLVLSRLPVASAQQHEPAHLSSSDDPLDGMLARLQQLNTQHRASRKAAARTRHTHPRRSPRRPQKSHSSSNSNGSSSRVSSSIQGGSSSTTTTSMTQAAPSLSSPSRQGAPQATTKVSSSSASPAKSSRSANVQVLDVSGDPDDPNQASMDAVLAKIYGRDTHTHGHAEVEAGHSQQAMMAVLSAPAAEQQQQQQQQGSSSSSGGGGSVGVAERSGAQGSYDDRGDEEEEEEEEEESLWPLLDEASSIYSLFGRGLTPERPAPSQASIDATLRAVLTEIFGPHGPHAQEASSSSSDSSSSAAVAAQSSGAQSTQGERAGLGEDVSAAHAAGITSWAGPDPTSIDSTLDAVLSRVFGPPAGAQQAQQAQQQQQQQQQQQGAGKKGRAYSLFGQVLTPDDPAPSQESIDAALSTVLAQVFGEGGLQQHQQEQQQLQQQLLQEERAAAISTAITDRSSEGVANGGEGSQQQQHQQESREAEVPAGTSSSAQAQEQVGAAHAVATAEVCGQKGSKGGEQSSEAASRESEIERMERKQKDNKGADRPAGFKGFGLPPTKSGASSPGASPASKSQASSWSTSPARAAFPASSSVPPLPVFLYCAEVGKTNDAIQRLGLEQHMKVVEDLKQAKAVLSVKMSKGGRQNNLQQGKRTAENHGIPFICVGRRMSQETLLPAIAQLLLDHRAQHGHSAESNDDLTRVLVAAAKTAEQQVQVQAGWAQRMMNDMGL